MINENKILTIIDSNNSSFFNFKDIYKYKDLILLFVVRDFKVFYKQTILGPFWYLFQPLLNSSVFTIVFGNLASLPTDDIPPFLFYMSGTIMWSYFSSTTMSISGVFYSNRDLFSKVYFPRLTVPIANVMINYLQFVIQFLILIIFFIYFHFKGFDIVFSYKVFFTLFLLLQLSIISIGFGCFFASITYKYKDLSLLLSFGMQLWMFITPVIYPLSIVDEKYIIFYSINPISSIIENFKFILFGNTNFNLPLTISSVIVSLMIFFFGIYIFNKVEKKFMDSI